MINSIIGSGVFGLPSIISRQLGPAGPIAWIVSAMFTGIVMACFAEVASRFTQAGGPYLYARVAFGRFAGILMGWLVWSVRLFSAAANANLFVIYLAQFWGQARDFVPRLLVLTLLIGVLAAINYRGVQAGTKVSNLFTAAKLLALILFIVIGGAYLLAHHQPLHITFRPSGTGPRLDAFLLLVFAYGGFEGALLPMGEAKDPRRDAPFALAVALLTCAVVCTLVQVVVMGALPNAAQTDRPLAEAARHFMGAAGATFIAVGALLSTYGYLASQALNVPRLTFALAENQDFPPAFAAVHPRFRTPYVSIIVFAGLLWVLSMLGSFQWNAVLSAIARLFYYAVICAALLVLRRRAPGSAWFRLPYGPVFAALGISISIVLVSGIRRSAAVIVAAIALIAFLNWLWASRRAKVLPASTTT
jgi:APA family basic amino acid/polyamine antiporter